MSNTTIADHLRSNLCHTLSSQKENKERMESLNKAIENIELSPLTERPYGFSEIVREVTMSVEFLEKLNSVYDEEVSRLVTILLEKNQTEI